MSKVLEETNGYVSESTFFGHDREWDGLKSQMSGLAGKMRALRKRMKDDGIDIEDFVYQKKKRAKSVSDQTASYERQRLYGQYWKMPVAVAQAELGTVADETGLTDEQRQKKWQDDGYVVGISGKGMDQNPHDPNSVAGRFWIEGWREGQKKLGEGIKQKKADAAKPKADGGATVTNITDGKRGRGRPKKGSLPTPPSGDDDKKQPEAAADQTGAQAHVEGSEPAAPPPANPDAEWDAADPSKAKPADDADPFAEPAPPPPGSTAH